MKLLPSPDQDGILYQVLRSENNLIEMGIWPTIFGYRIHAGFVGAVLYRLDWCGGSEQWHIEWLYTHCKAILEKRPEDGKAFDGIPSESAVKPYMLDNAFVGEVDVLADYPEEYVELPPLSKIRSAYMAGFSDELNDLFRSMGVPE